MMGLSTSFVAARTNFMFVSDVAHTWSCIIKSCWGSSSLISSLVSCHSTHLVQYEYFIYRRFWEAASLCGAAAFPAPTGPWHSVSISAEINRLTVKLHWHHLTVRYWYINGGKDPPWSLWINFTYICWILLDNCGTSYSLTFQNLAQSLSSVWTSRCWIFAHFLPPLSVDWYK